MKAGTADNDLNYFSKIYPGMVIGTSAYLDSTYNTKNPNTDTSYFCVSRNHSIRRKVRKPLTTELVPPTTDKQDRYYYKARFRELAYALSWEGIVGSDGTT